MSAPARTEIYVSYSPKDKELIDPYIKNLSREYRLRPDHSFENSSSAADDPQEMQRSAAGTIVFWGMSGSTDERVTEELQFGYSLLNEPGSNKFLILIAHPSVKPSSLAGVVTTFYMEKDGMEQIMNGVNEVVMRHTAQSVLQSAKTMSATSPIIELQTMLRDKGFFKGRIDGIFGQQTKAALKEFQKQNNLPVRDDIKAGDIDADFVNQLIIAGPVTQPAQSPGGPNYWIIRLAPKIDIETLAKNTPYSLDIGHKRMDPSSYGYDRVEKIKSGDYLAGYQIQGRLEFFVCTFRVTKGFSPGHYDDVTFELEEKFKEPSTSVPLDFEGVRLSDLLIIEIDKVTFEKIVEAVKGIKTKPGEGKEKKPFENNFRPFFLPEGDHKDTQDQLQFENDINSFASVISLKKVKPPLAIGLFGNWGSGKSFFMEKLYQKIEKLAEHKEDPDNIQNVVQVKFNSWHYSDANLWASLITEIFDSLSRFSRRTNNDSELEKISDTLQITTLQKAAMETRRSELENSIRQLKDEQTEKRRRLEDLSGISLLKLIFSDEKVKSDISKLGVNATVEDLAKNKDKLDEYSKELEKTSTAIRSTWSFIRSLKGWKGLAVILSVILIPTIIFLLLRYFPEQLANVKSWLNETTATIATVVAWMGNFIYRGINNVNKAKEGLESMKNTLANRPQATSAELEEKMNELIQVTGTLEYLNKKIDEAKKEIEDVRTGRKLLEFIEQRTRDENYSKQLGLISWIRKDFEKLDDLLRKQHEVTEQEKKEIDNPQEVTLRIDRIILYVDDLDRCKEETVVRVLEAIHLLLAFPLFVVIVGVDPRWLNNALSEKYKTLFGQKTSKENNDDTGERDLFLSGAATTYDYLEKIFQIPFTLKPIDKPGREKLIDYLLKNEMKKQAKDKEEEEKEKEKQQQDQKKDKIKDVGHDPKETGKKTPQNTGGDQERKDLQAKKEVALTFTDEEKKFMQEVSPIFGYTPRGINRYVNIYRIIKAHKSLNVDDDFSADEYIPIMVILSVVVGYSLFAQQFVKKLSEAKATWTFENFLDQKDIPDEIKKPLKEHLHDDVFQLPVTSFKKNAGLISRFSFRTLVPGMHTE